MDKHWVDIIGFEDNYEINKLGIVRNKKRKTVIKPYNNKAGRGYLYVCLYKGKIIKKISVHRLLAIHFIKNERGFNVVNHIDGNTMNNDLSNLEWTTHAINMRHSVEMGLRKTNYINHIDDIIYDYKKGFTLGQISRKYKSHVSTIKRLLIREGVKIRNPYDYTKSGYQKYELKIDILIGSTAQQLKEKYPISIGTIKCFMHKYKNAVDICER